MIALSAFGSGILFGFLLTLMIGPVFFALIQTSIEKGFASGGSMAVGIALSDAIYVLVASLGVAVMANSPKFQGWLGLVGGTIMLVFGIGNFLKKIKEASPQQTNFEAHGLAKEALKGFLLNGINPFVLLFWFGIAALNYHYNFNQKICFFMGILLTVLVTDLLKAYTATKLRKWLTPKFMLRMNKLVGIALIIFSIKLFYFAYEIFVH